mgnify:CR=1 FL=1
MKKATVRRFGAVLVGLSLVAGACGSDEEAVTEETEAVTEETEAPAAETVPGSELKGMKGTTPLVELSDDFKTGINEFWTGKGNEALTDFNYAGESFDAVMLIALAAEAAKSDGSEMADQVVAVSKDGTKCSTWADCTALIKAGTDVEEVALRAHLPLADRAHPARSRIMSGLEARGPMN